MKAANLLRATALGILLAAPAREAQAQTEIGAQLDLFSSYVWRGVTYTNKPVAQPDLWVSFPAGNASITAGGWANIDIGKYDDPANDISESGGLSAFNFAEFNPYAEVSFATGKATLTGGIVGYIYPNDLTTPPTGGSTASPIPGRYTARWGSTCRSPRSCRSTTTSTRSRVRTSKAESPTPFRWGSRTRSTSAAGRPQPGQGFRGRPILQFRGRRADPSGLLGRRAAHRRHLLDHASAAFPDQRGRDHQVPVAEQRRERCEALGRGVDRLVERGGGGGRGGRGEITRPLASPGTRSVQHAGTPPPVRCRGRTRAEPRPERRRAPAAPKTDAPWR